MIVRAFFISAALTLSASALADETKTGADAPPPPWSMADDYYDKTEMEKSRKAVQKSHGGMNSFMVLGDRLEFQFGEFGEHFLWDAQGWYGGDYNKIFIKTEGEYSFEESGIEDAEIQALWSRAVTSFWDVQAGLRYDLNPKGRAHAVLGLQGLAPLWFEVDAAAFLSADGDLSARIEAEYDYRFTQRLIVQPRAEISLSASDNPKLNTQSGLTSASIGARLRYDIKREFAPYAGLEWQGKFGAANDDDNDDAIIAVIGLKTWY